MKKIGVILCCLLLTCAGLTAQNLPDSGFTDKSEAKNLTVNGLKEGKWIEYPYFTRPVHLKVPNYVDHPVKKYPDRPPINDGSYSLTIYHNGIPIGTVRGYFTNGILREVSYYSNGLLNGAHKVFYSNGNLCFVGNYINGKLNGEYRNYYMNCILSSTTTYKDDTIIGMSRTFYPSGKIECEIPFAHNKLNGVEHYYYENGKLQYQATFANGKKETEKSYDEKGNEIK